MCYANDTLNFFFSSYPLEIKYDGKGSLRNIKDTVQDLKQMPNARFFVDLSTFVGDNAYTNYTRSRFIDTLTSQNTTYI